MPISIALLLVGTFLIYLAPKSEDPILALALGVMLALGGAYALVYTAVTLRRIPSVHAYYLGRATWHYFWFNNAGIWKDKRLLAP